METAQKKQYSISNFTRKIRHYSIYKERGKSRGGNEETLQQNCLKITTTKYLQKVISLLLRRQSIIKRK